MTESPDETAQGEWLDLVTKPGFSYLMAHVKYLRDGRYTVERIEEDGQRDSTSITLLRVRPVRPGRRAGDNGRGDHERQESRRNVSTTLACGHRQEARRMQDAGYVR